MHKKVSLIHDDIDHEESKDMNKKKIWKRLGSSITFQTRKNLGRKIIINLRWNTIIKKIIRKNIEVSRIFRKKINAIIIINIKKNVW